MRRHAIISSVFKTVGYNREIRILEVEFRDSGDIWQYHNFPPLAYKKFINAESRGNFFTTYIRNKYPEVQMV